MRSWKSYSQFGFGCELSRIDSLFEPWLSLVQVEPFQFELSSFHRSLEVEERQEREEERG